MAALTSLKVWVYQASNGQYSFYGEDKNPNPPGTFVGLAKLKMVALDATTGKDILPPLTPPVVNVNQGVLPI